MKKLFLIIFFLLTSGKIYAKCEGSIVSKKDVVSLQNNITLLDIIKKFGTGCLGGKKVVNTMYREKDGETVLNSV